MFSRQSPTKAIYLTTLCVLLFLFYEYTLRVSDSVIVPNLMQAFHVNAVGIGLISSGYYFVYVAMQIPAGFLIDRFRWQYIIIAAIALVTLGSFIFSATQSLSLAIFARILMGIGSSFAFVTSVKLVMNILKPKNPAYWIGIIMTIATLGAAFGQSPWLWFISYLPSWRSAYFIAGLVGIALLLATAFFSRKLPAHYHKAEKLNLRVFLPIFKTRDIWLLGLFIGFLSAPYTAFAGLWGVPFLNQGHGLTLMAAAQLISFTWFGGLLGGPLLGYLSDRFHAPRTVLMTCGILNSLLMLIILFAPLHSFTVLLSLLMLMGLLSNGNVIIFAEMSQRVPDNLKGLMTGITNMFNMGMGPILQMLIGILLASFGGMLLNGITHYNLHAYQMSLLCIPCGLIVFSVLLKLVKFNHLPKE
jgi:MFS family permease